MGAVSLSHLFYTSFAYNALPVFKISHHSFSQLIGSNSTKSEKDTRPSSTLNEFQISDELPQIRNDEDTNTTQVENHIKILDFDLP